MPLELDTITWQVPFKLSEGKGGHSRQNNNRRGSPQVRLWFLSAIWELTTASSQQVHRAMHEASSRWRGRTPSSGMVSACLLSHSLEKIGERLQADIWNLHSSLPAFSHSKYVLVGSTWPWSSDSRTHYSTYEHSYKQLKQNEKYRCTFNSFFSPQKKKREILTIFCNN